MTPQNLRVLIVDDDAAMLDMVKIYLERRRFVVSTAQTPDEFSAVYKNETPDYILMDACLGNADGFELLRWFRQKHDTPVIMMTGLNRPDDRARSFEAGASDYLGKPFLLRELVERIEKLATQPAPPAPFKKTQP